MKLSKKVVYLAALFSCLCLCLQLTSIVVFAQEDSRTIIVDRFPQHELFNVANSKPGDTAHRPFVFQNNYDLDILYTLEVRSVDDVKLFNELELYVTSGDKVLFDGMLKDFTGFTDRPLARQSEETADFTLKFPEALGNEFQGTVASFVFEFSAKADSDSGIVSAITDTRGGSSGLGGTLPQTATNMITYLLIGGTLIILGATVKYLNNKKERIKA